jgi:hypothetical protein
MRYVTKRNFPTHKAAFMGKSFSICKNQPSFFFHKTHVKVYFAHTGCRPDRASAVSCLLSKRTGSLRCRDPTVPSMDRCHLNVLILC